MIEYLENGDLALVDGLIFRRDKRTGYYLNAKTHKRLHRYIWEKANGPIAPGLHIHHIDMNKHNNDISNLAIMTSVEHEALHGKLLTDEQRKRLRDNLQSKARPAANEWHGSEEGKDWHKRHYDRMKDALYQKGTFDCVYCGKKYEAINHGTNRFCSNKCRAAHRRKTGVDNEKRNCAYCGGEFNANKYAKTQACSRDCAGKIRWNKINTA